MGVRADLTTKFGMNLGIGSKRRPHPRPDRAAVDADHLPAVAVAVFLGAANLSAASTHRPGHRGIVAFCFVLAFLIWAPAASRSTWSAC